jgi:hypothetical protein
MYGLIWEKMKEERFGVDEYCGFESILCML